MIKVGSQVKVHLAILILCLPYRVLEGTLALADVVQGYTLEFLLVIHLSFSASHASQAITASIWSQAWFMTCLTKVWTEQDEWESPPPRNPDPQRLANVLKWTFSSEPGQNYQPVHPGPPTTLWAALVTSPTRDTVLFVDQFPCQPPLQLDRLCEYAQSERIDRSVCGRVSGRFALMECFT